MASNPQTYLNSHPMRPRPSKTKNMQPQLPPHVSDPSNHLAAMAIPFHISLDDHDTIASARAEASGFAFPGHAGLFTSIRGTVAASEHTKMHETRRCGVDKDATFPPLLPFSNFRISNFVCLLFSPFSTFHVHK